MLAAIYLTHLYPHPQTVSIYMRSVYAAILDRILLENGIQMIGEDDCPALWEKLLLIESQYSMSPSSLGDIVKVSVGVFLHGIVAEAVLQRESQEAIITGADQFPVSLQRIQRTECV